MPSQSKLLDFKNTFLSHRGMPWFLSWINICCAPPEGGNWGCRWL